MKSFVPAALVVVLEAGFIFSVASLPGAPGHVTAQMEVARSARVGAAATQTAQASPVARHRS